MTWDASPLIGDEEVEDGEREGEGDEGDKEGLAEEVVDGGIARVEDGDGDVVEGIAAEEVGVAEVEEVVTDPEVVGRVFVGLDDDGTGEDNPP